MPSPLREVPEHIWWCFICNGGVGCWGVSDGPPPRCPDCKGSDLAPVKFVPDPKEKLEKLAALAHENSCVAQGRCSTGSHIMARKILDIINDGKEVRDGRGEAVPPAAPGA